MGGKLRFNSKRKKPLKMAKYLKVIKIKTVLKSPNTNDEINSIRTRN